MSYNEKARELVDREVLHSFNQMMDKEDVSEEFYEEVSNYWSKTLIDPDGIVRELNYEYDDNDLIPSELWESEVRPALENLITEKDDDDEIDIIQSVIDDTDNTEEEPAEIYEYWIITDRLHRWLNEKGECVSEVGGMSIWGRCCTGQAIILDNVIQEIYKEKY